MGLGGTFPIDRRLLQPPWGIAPRDPSPGAGATPPWWGLGSRSCSAEQRCIPRDLPGSGQGGAPSPPGMAVLGLQPLLLADFRGADAESEAGGGDQPGEPPRSPPEQLHVRGGGCRPHQWAADQGTVRAFSPFTRPLGAGQGEIFVPGAPQGGQPWGLAPLWAQRELGSCWSLWGAGARSISAPRLAGDGGARPCHWGGPCCPGSWAEGGRGAAPPTPCLPPARSLWNHRRRPRSGWISCRASRDCASWWWTSRATS